MVWIIASGASLVAFALAVTLVLWRRKLTGLLWAPLTVAVIGTLSTVGLTTYLGLSDSSTEAMHPVVRSLESIAWPNPSAALVPEARPSSATPVTTAPAPGNPSAGPVSELLGGLEARLAAAPDDAKGWALLAQSYAFVGNDEAAEEALGRAVALGFDEAELRERVNMALHSPGAPNWIERTIGG